MRYQGPFKVCASPILPNSAIVSKIVYEAVRISEACVQLVETITTWYYLYYRITHCQSSLTTYCNVTP